MDRKICRYLSAYYQLTHVIWHAMQTSKKNPKSPLFFTELDALIRSLPSQYSKKSINLPHKDYPENPHLSSYLTHYDLQLVDKLFAKSYCMWATKISLFHHSLNETAHYIIVQQHWQTTEDKKGTVVIVHGYLDHTGLYGNAIRWALTQGYDVLSFDLPGHGLSSGEPAAIIHFDLYSEVLNHVINEHLNILHTPLIALGQSTGCAVICNALLKTEQQNSTLFSQEKSTHKNMAHTHLFSQAILLAPLVRSQHWRWLRYAYFLLRPSISSIQRKFVRSSHNRKFNQFIKHSDPLQASRISLLWLGAMEQWYQTIRYSSQTCDISLTIIQGAGDTTVDWRYNIPALSQIFTHHYIHYIPDAQHHLVNESPEYWHTVETYLTQQINKS
jgi:alpha-beta hydrolase superfamily lysophospholipase